MLPRPCYNNALMNPSPIAPPEPFGGLIFDCDGTLADTMPNHYRAWADALRASGAEFTEQRFYEMAGMPSADIIRALNREGGYDLDVDRTHDDKERRYVELLHTVTEIEAVAEVARAYRGRVPMAVASSGIRAVVDQTLTATGLLSLFDAVVTGDEVVQGKPAPDIFLLAARRLGLAPADCVVYEDGDVGLEAARRAGMRAVDVRVLWR